MPNQPPRSRTLSGGQHDTTDGPRKFHQLFQQAGFLQIKLIANHTFIGAQQNLSRAAGQMRLVQHLTPHPGLYPLGAW